MEPRPDKRTAAEVRLTPLAELARPRQLHDVVGQAHLLGPGKPLREVIDSGLAQSMVLWGPPGTGKTTLAQIYAHSLEAQLISLSAVRSGISDIRGAVDKGCQAKLENRATIVFVDEVHRFNKTQQDAFLPHIESGDVIFVGATTENPSFQLNGALLSRLKVYVLNALEADDIRKVIRHALAGCEHSGPDGFFLSQKSERIFAEAAQGDARRALNFLEIAASLTDASGNQTISDAMSAEIAGQPLARFDRQGDVFYELISALHKSVRGSDPDASLYWLARMLAGGCDPLYAARRAVRIASEDIGNADPNALNVALRAWDACERLGSPEGELAIAQAVAYLACCPKSNAVYRAFGSACEDARRYGHLEVPKHLRNAPTALMKELGYGRDYRHAHDEPDGVASGAVYFPDGMPQAQYYQPVDRGVEKRIRQYMEKIREHASSSSADSD